MAEPSKVGSDEFMEQVRLTLDTGLKLKTKMLDRKLTIARTICPRCGHRLNAAIAGPKNHFRMACITPGCLQMME